MSKITVPQVCKNLGIHPDKKLMWSVGLIMQARYANIFGKQPPKDLRPKTNGGGVHCFALYPSDWYQEIADEIIGQEHIRLNQIELF